MSRKQNRIHNEGIRGLVLCNTNTTAVQADPSARLLPVSWCEDAVGATSSFRPRQDASNAFPFESSPLGSYPETEEVSSGREDVPDTVDRYDHTRTAPEPANYAASVRHAYSIVLRYLSSAQSPLTFRPTYTADLPEQNLIGKSCCPRGTPSTGSGVEREKICERVARVQPVPEVWKSRLT